MSCRFNMLNDDLINKINGAVRNISCIGMLGIRQLCPSPEECHTIHLNAVPIDNAVKLTDRNTLLELDHKVVAACYCF